MIVKEKTRRADAGRAGCHSWRIQAAEKWGSARNARTGINIPFPTD
jgi:hypothetical protein